MALQKGLFFVFEGIDGSGKTSQLAALQSYLEEKGHIVHRTLEPTDGQWGTKAMNLILNGRGDISPEEELSYFIKDREEHVTISILPWLQEKSIVLQDRYYYSTAAYQGALDIDSESILQQNRIFAPEPDAVFCLDIDVDTAIHRICVGRGDTPDHFENKPYLSKVSAIYQQFQFPNLHHLDGTMSAEDLSATIRDIVDPILVHHAD